MSERNVPRAGLGVFGSKLVIFYSFLFYCSTCFVFGQFLQRPTFNIKQLLEVTSYTYVLFWFLTIPVKLNFITFVTAIQDCITFLENVCLPTYSKIIYITFFQQVDIWHFIHFSEIHFEDGQHLFPVKQLYKYWLAQQTFFRRIIYHLGV